MDQKILIYQLLDLHHTPSIQLSLVKIALALSSSEIKQASELNEENLYSLISLLSLKKYDTMFDAVVPKAINPLTIVVNKVLETDTTLPHTPDDWHAPTFQKAVIIRLLSIMAISDGLIDDNESKYINTLKDKFNIDIEVMDKVAKYSKSQLLSKLTLNTIGEFQPDFIRLALVDKDLDISEKGILKEISLLKRSLKSLKVFWP
jgi:hypothetical protein